MPFWPPLFGYFVLPFNGHVVICCTCSEGRATLGSDPSAETGDWSKGPRTFAVRPSFNTHTFVHKAINPGGLGASPHYNCQNSLLFIANFALFRVVFYCRSPSVLGCLASMLGSSAGCPVYLGGRDYIFILEFIHNSCSTTARCPVYHIRCAVIQWLVCSLRVAKYGSSLSLVGNPVEIRFWSC